MLRHLVTAMFLLTPALALSAAEGCPTCPTCPAAGKPADMAIADLKSAIAGKTVLLIDANGSASYAKGHLPGAIDFAAHKDDLAKALPADKAALIVAYCGGPQCGAWKSAAGAVAKLGYTNIKHFSGGISGWQEAGEKLEPAIQ